MTTRPEEGGASEAWRRREYRDRASFVTASEEMRGGSDDGVAAGVGAVGA